MSAVAKGKGGANPGPTSIDFASALDGVTDKDFSNKPTTAKKVDAKVAREGSENAGFNSRPVIKQVREPEGQGDLVAPQVLTTQRAKPAIKARTRAKRKKETARVALRTDPEVFELLKDLAAEQDPPWSIGYAFEKAVQALEEKLELAK